MRPYRKIFRRSDQYVQTGLFDRIYGLAMETASRPTSPEQNLWDSILNSVSTRRSIPSGNVLILGEPCTGKTTLANALLQRLAEGNRNEMGERFSKTDFALGYEWANVKEEGEEGLRYSPRTYGILIWTQSCIDIVARLSVYTVPSSNPSHLSLVPHFLPPKTSLHRTLVMIVLDWTKPWSFMDQLKTWLSWVEEWSAQDPSREVQVLREEGRERCKLHAVFFAVLKSCGIYCPLKYNRTCNITPSQLDQVKQSLSPLSLHQQ